MIEATETPHPDPPIDDRPAEPAELPPAGVPGGGSTVDEMSEWSFPASDPPAVWTWEPAAPS